MYWIWKPDDSMCRGSILSENSKSKCVLYVEANYRCVIATAITSIVVVLYSGWTPHIRGFRSYYGLRILSIREAWPP